MGLSNKPTIEYTKKRKKKEKKRKKTGWCTEKKLKTKNLFHLYFLAYVIFMAQTAVILKPCSASLATPACVSLSNSTNDMSCFPGTRRTSLKPGNLEKRKKFLFIFIKITTKWFSESSVGVWKTTCFNKIIYYIKLTDSVQFLYYWFYCTYKWTWPFIELDHSIRENSLVEEHGQHHLVGFLRQVT